MDFIFDLLAELLEGLFSPVSTWIGETIEHFDKKAPMLLRIFIRILLVGLCIGFVVYLIFLATQSSRWRIILSCFVIVAIALFGISRISSRYKNKR